MPNNETFQIDKFQIKICKAWETSQKNYIPLEGEPIYITTSISGVSTPIFVIGNGINNLNYFISNGHYYAYKQNIPQPPQSGTDIQKTTTDGTSSPGTATTWARSNHKHSLDRKITVGTSEPSGGSNGDIYIQIEDNA